MFQQIKAAAQTHTIRRHSAETQEGQTAGGRRDARTWDAAILTSEPQLEHLKLESASGAISLPAEQAASWKDVPFDERVRLRIDPELPEDLSALRALPKSREPDPLIGRYALLDTKHDDQVVASLTLRRKRRPRCRGHIVLSNSNLDARMRNVYRITAGLLLLKACGPGSFGFLSCFAPGPRNRDFECVREALPIWEHVSQEGWLPLAGGHVQTGKLRGWFFQAPCFSSAGSRALSGMVWKYLEQDPPRWHDLLMAYFDGWYQCIPVQRRATKPLSFSALQPDEYGDFGGLELCGLMANIKTQAMVQALADEPASLRRQRLQAAYREICVSRKG